MLKLNFLSADPGYEESDPDPVLSRIEPGSGFGSKSRVDFIRICNTVQLAVSTIELHVLYCRPGQCIDAGVPGQLPHPHSQARHEQTNQQGQPGTLPERQVVFVISFTLLSQKYKSNSYTTAALRYSTNLYQARHEQTNQQGQPGTLPQRQVVFVISFTLLSQK